MLWASVQPELRQLLDRDIPSCPNLDARNLASENPCPGGVVSQPDARSVGGESDQVDWALQGQYADIT